MVGRRWRRLILFFFREKYLKKKSFSRYCVCVKPNSCRMSFMASPPFNYFRSTWPSPLFFSRSGKEEPKSPSQKENCISQSSLKKRSPGGSRKDGRSIFFFFFFFSLSALPHKTHQPPFLSHVFNGFLTTPPDDSPFTKKTKMKKKRTLSVQFPPKGTWSIIHATTIQSD